MLQSSLLPRLAIDGGKPNLVLALVSLWSLLRGAKQGSIWALIAGIETDLLSGAPFGISTLCLLAVSLWGGQRRLQGFQSRFLVPILITAVAVLIHDGLFLGVLQMMGRPVSWLDCTLHVTLPSVALTVVLVPFLYPPLRHLARPPESEEPIW